MITEKMAACTFSHDALPMSIENYGIKMTQDHQMMRKLSRMNKSIFQKTFIRLLKDFGPQCIAGKMYTHAPPFSQSWIDPRLLDTLGGGLYSKHA